MFRRPQRNAAAFWCLSVSDNVRKTEKGRSAVQA